MSWKYWWVRLSAEERRAVRRSWPSSSAAARRAAYHRSPTVQRRREVVALTASEVTRYKERGRGVHWVAVCGRCFVARAGFGARVDAAEWLLGHREKCWSFVGSSASGDGVGSVGSSPTPTLNTECNAMVEDRGRS